MYELSLNWIWLFVMFFGLMFLGVQIGMSLFISVCAYMAIFAINPLNAVIRAITGPMSTTLLSLGFFLLAGNIMNNGGVTRKLFGFCETIVGWIPGGLGHANVVASVIFAGMSGSAAADAGGLGQIEIKAMTDSGYELPFACAVTGASSVIGPIIPPSTPAILLAVITGLSTGRLFMAGIIPGLILGLALMACVFVISKKRHYPRTPFPTWKTFWKSLKESFFALLTPVIILVCIYSGIITPAESAVLACCYAILLGLISKDIKPFELLEMFRDTGKLYGRVLSTVFTSYMFSYVITVERVNVAAAEIVTRSISSWQGFMILTIIILIICGATIDNTATIMLITPVLYPIGQAYGVDGVHFCLLFSLTLMMGVITPPVGGCLFIMQRMTGVDFGDMVRECWPFIFTTLAVVLLVAFVPALSTWIPNLVYGVV